MTSTLASLGRSYWVATAAILYTCLGAARSGGGVLPWLGLVLLPLGLAEVYRRTRSATADERLSLEAQSAVRATFWGAALLIAARTGASARPALDAAANLGAGAAAVGALVALARLPGNGGLLEAPRAARSLDAALFVGFVWGIATAVPGATAILPAPSVRLDPLVIDYVTTSAAIGTLLVMTAATLRLRLLRRLELGVGDRARSAFALSVAAFTIAVPAAWLDIAPPDRVLPAAVCVAAVGAAWAATTKEATRVTRLLRGVLAVMILGAPLLVIGTLVAQAAPGFAPAIVLTSGILAIVVGVFARELARPLGPEHSRWLIALDRAARDALQPEPNAALRGALVALGQAAGAAGGRPEIWQRDPPEVMSVDIAGYLHETRAEAPPRIYELGLGEPERTVRTDVLRALQVRKPEVRPLLAWLEAREAFSATLVVDEDGPLGFILLPRGQRTTPMTLEEARAARLLADRISSLLAVAAALSRSRTRELSAIERADAADDECRRLEHIVGADADRHRGLAERLARPVRRAAYSAAARLSLDRLANLGKQSALVALVMPPGTDAVPWAAHVHLTSPRSTGPFVILDGASAEEQSPEHFSDELRSPLRFADGGTLLILAATALPRATQETLALQLARRAAHTPKSSILSPGVVIALSQGLPELLENDRLSPTLARWFEDTSLVLPSLSERAEDIFALSLDILARRCLELGKPPYGIDSFALRLLLEHTWPGNDIELSGVLGRLAAVASGPSVTAKDLESIGFAPNPARSSEKALEPAPSRRRPSRRPLR